MKVCSWLVLLIAMPGTHGALCQAAVISTFTGGDVGEGLDLDGTFMYAIQGGGSGDGVGSHAVRNATFQVDIVNPATQNIPGVIANGQAETRPTNSGITYGATTNDNELETVMNGYLVSTGFQVGGRLSYEMSVTAGLQYEVQVLLNENFYGTGNQGGNSGNTRENSYFLYNGAFTDNVGTGSTLYDSAINVNVISLVGVGNVDTTGVVVTMLFTALSNTVTLTAAPGTTTQVSGNPDRVAIINALTIKAVPEPGTFTMMAFAAFALACFRSQRHRCA